jgi:U3 small nucleolar RNA-associated protein 21
MFSVYLNLSDPPKLYVWMGQLKRTDSVISNTRNTFFPVFQLDVACTSLSLSPTGDLLATTHVNYLGVFLWSNRTLYSHVSLRPLSEETAVPLLKLPTTVAEILEDMEDETQLDDGEPNFKSCDQISEDLVTLSLVASSRWQNLLDVDVVRKRNKPKEPPKVPKAAPFFLPTLPSLSLQFDLTKTTDKEEANIRMPASLQSLSGFAQLLNDAAETNNFQPLVAKLKAMGPSMIDFEISSLAPEGGGSVDLMLLFMKLIESMLISNKDFELAQAYLGLFLKTHGDLIASERQLRDYIPKLQHCQITGWESLQSKLLYNLCVTQSLKGM